MRRFLFLTLFSVACGSAQPRTPGPSNSPPAQALQVDPARPELGVAAPGPKCAEPNLPASPEREKAIDAFLADRPRDAADTLDAYLRDNPRDRAAEAFRQATEAKLAEGQTHATDDLTRAQKIALQTIPLAQATLGTPDTGAPPGNVKLEKVSEAKNLITDELDWEQKNKVPSPHFSRDSLPSNLPFALVKGDFMHASFKHADHSIAVYRGIVAVVSGGKKPLVFDTRRLLAAAPRPLDVDFAQIVGNTLVLGLAYNGYAKDANGKNGYFAAFDTKTGQLLWCSDPLVMNAHEAVISGGSIIGGYGFTAEPHFMFVLDLATGKTTQKLAIVKSPSAIRLRDDRLYVRTYDTDYVFKSTTAFAKTPPANLPGVEAGPAVVPSAEARCWVRRATAAILAKDPNGIHEAAERLRPLSNDRTLDELLTIQENALRSNDPKIDLAAVPLIVVATPPWEATPARGGAAAPKLVKVASHAASPVRNMDAVFDPRKPWFIAPVDKGKVPPGARPGIPSSYGHEDLRAIIPDENNRHILIYGGRYVALVSAEGPERVFDLEGFRHPPKANPQWKEFAVEDATHALTKDNVLYVCNGGGSYAKEVFGKKGFVSALDATTGKLLWRSQPLVCNSTFILAGDHLVTGYGFTAEPDFVFLLRRSDGSIAQKVPVDTGPDTIELLNGKIHVETYGHVVDFELH